MAAITSIIFDLGGVLIDWNPRYLFDEDYFDTLAKRDHFLSHICTDDWNEEQDGGRPIVEGTEKLVEKFPAWETAIRDYYGRWTKMLHGPIDGTVEIFRRLKENKNLKFYALTNWSAELFPIALKRFDFLHWFDGRVVSGEEKMRKPFPAFYQLLLHRYAVNREEALLIDDNLRNVKVAESLGIRSIHFNNAEQLKKELGTLQLVS